jgi:Na+-driven multidrug efflux pump
MGIRSGIQPIIGYNYGARLFGRARQTLLLSIAITCAICTVAYALLFMFSAQTIGLFVRNAPAVVDLGVTGIRIFFASMPILSIAILGTGYFQAVNKVSKALVPNLVRQLIPLVPLYFFLPRLFGICGVWMAGPISDAAAVLITMAFLNPEMRRLATSGREVAALSPTARAAVPQ